MGTIEQQFGKKRAGDNKYAFFIIFLFMVLSLGSVATVLDTMKLPKIIKEKIVKVQASFEIAQEKKKPIPPKKKKVEKKKKKKAPKKKKVVKKKPKPKPIDLTKKPKLKAKKDVIVKAPKKVRKVYGVDRVYSQGLGSGGSMSNAVVAKVGNTINKEYDTLTATKADLKGEVVSQVTVTKAPSFKRRVKPSITPEMKKNNVEGVIKVKVLVDIDGRVKKALAKNNLGFGTKEAAIKACLAMEFFPAVRGKEPVAVWITIPIRFSKIG